MCTIHIDTTKTYRKSHTIWVKSKVQNGIGMKSENVKHLYVNDKGYLNFHINGLMSILGRTRLNDRNKHDVAVRYTKSDKKFSLFVDGIEENRRIIVKKWMSPQTPGSVFRVGIQVGEVESFDGFGQITNIKWSSDQSKFNKMIGLKDNG